MCHRYLIGQEETDESLKRYVSEAGERAGRLGVNMIRQGEIRPTDIVPVIAPDRKHRIPSAFPMKWGFKHPSRDVMVFNARSETAPEKTFYVTSVQDRRCLVPASSYYEWRKEEGKKIRYSFTGQDGMLYLAALYIRSSSELLPCFSILTCDAPEEISFIHRRMPLIVPEKNIGDWLSADVPYEEAIRVPAVKLQYREG